MSRWTHALCEECWVDCADPPGREPVRSDRDEETCCRCAAVTTSGIYYREDPEKLWCRGKHDEPATMERRIIEGAIRANIADDHRYDGMCPGAVNPEVRDPGCATCRLIVRALGE